MMNFTRKGKSMSLLQIFHHCKNVFLTYITYKPLETLKINLTCLISPKTVKERLMYAHYRYHLSSFPDLYYLNSITTNIDGNFSCIRLDEVKGTAQELHINKDVVLYNNIKGNEEDKKSEVEERDTFESSLSKDQVESYTKYLASQIYEHQMRLKHAPASHKNNKVLVHKVVLLLSAIQKSFNRLVTQSFPYFKPALCLKVFVGVILFSNLHAQTTLVPKDIEPLRIGDTIPEVLWNMKFTANSHGDSKTFQLKDYQGKLILLDFWATWCASCINGFPKMEELQKAYVNELKIILVNAQQSNDSYARVQKVLEHYRSTYGYEIGLDYLLADSILQQYFPHKILPHLIWIDKHRVLRAASYGKSATMLNVRNALNGDFSGIHQKNDYVLDKQGFLVSELSADRVLYRRVLTAYIEGLGIKSETLVNQDGRKYYQIWNKSLSSLYFAAFADEFRHITPDRFRFDHDVDSAWIQSFLASANVNNKYCYETLLPNGGSESEGRFMLSQDLLAYFGYKPVRKKINTKVMIIRESTKLSSLESKGGIPRAQLDPSEGVMYLQNNNLRSLYSFIASRLNMPYELVQESGYRIDLKLPSSFADYSPNQIIKYLSSLGVDVDLVTKEIDIVQFIKI